MLKKPSVLYVVIATVALSAGLLVYLLDRPPEHVYFLSHGLTAAHAPHAWFGVAGNYLPAFLHAYAFVLLTVAVTGSSNAHLIRIGAAWFAIASLFEFGQHPVASPLIAASLPAWFAHIPVLDNTAAYFLRGTFDPLDFLSIALGTVAAYLTIAIPYKAIRTTFQEGQHRVLRHIAIANVTTLGVLTIIASGGGGSTPDTTPPTVASTNPASAATVVAIGTDITATFSEAMTASTVNAATFTLTDTGGTSVPARVSYSGTTATLQPNTNLVPTTTYTATITTGVKDLAGNAMVADYVWSFTTTTDSWLSTTTTGAPTPRSDHTAVWTGTKTIVWGGTDGLGPTNTGSRYDPSTDSWQATAASGLTGRSSHTAIWTGSRMIVWGGTDSSGPTNTGGRYDPSADSWQSIEINGAPSQRTRHASVWTGSEMIVWGGSGSLGFLTNTGGRYDPAANTWRSMSTVGASSGRTGHTAVWTGTEMIVWGGNDGGLTSTGSRYNPSTDTWQTVSTIGSPSARSGHTAIWTGTHMLVWGGNDGSLTNTGAIYDPTTDTWQTITVTGAPAGRSGHTAVWSGSEMIVWGGSGLNNGGRYTP